MSTSILRTEHLCKSFGGLAAVSDVSLNVRASGVHAVIGPNGAGKSTLVNLLSGELTPTSGRIWFDGRDITSLKSYRVARLGMGRSYQKTNIFPGFTCMENCWLAAQSLLPGSMRFIRPAQRLTSIRARAREALETCGLTHRQDTIASNMSYGEQRQLEIGMVLSGDPSLLLLDEPMAGMGSEESERVVDLLRKLAEHYPIVLVEHDMDAVFSIASELSVMTDGQVLAHGSVEEVRNNPAVQAAYLGTEAEDVMP